MNVYVAGASSRWQQCRAFMERLRAEGFDVTADWTQEVERARAAGVPDSQLSAADRRGFARADLDGVDDAEVFVLLAEGASVGMWVEFGWALALNMRGVSGPVAIVVVGGERRSIFTSLARAEIPDEDAAIRYLRDLRGPA